MSKFRSSIIIIGLLVSIVAASLLTALGLYVSGAIVTEKIELTFSVQNEEKVYDGTPLVATAYEITEGELLEGHYAEVDFLGSQTDAGKSASTLSVRICNERGFDVTSDYKIAVENGLLTVEQREIKINLGDEEVVYNGTKVNFENYTVTEGELVAGHTVAGSQNVQLINVNDLVPNDIRPVIFDLLGNDVTKNYDITEFTMGEIRVLPRPIMVKPTDITKTYDGKEVTVETVDILSGSLVEGHYFKNLEVNSGDDRFLDVSDSASTRITKLAIYRLDGSKEVDVTKNYDLDYLSETGSVNIQPRKLTITARSYTFPYDGVVHAAPEAENQPLSCVGLVTGERLVSVDYEGSIKNVGTEQNAISGLHFDNVKENNYEIELVVGWLTVTIREVTIVTPTISQEYDGTIVWGASELHEPRGINLATNHVIVYDEDAEHLPYIVNFGSMTNQFECRIVDQDAPDEDLSSNYHITYSYGQLTVTKRTVRVTTLSDSKVYDGMPLYGCKTKEDVKIENLAQLHTFKVATGEDNVFITNAEKKSNAFKITISDIEMDYDVTENYDIVYQYGTLEITPRPITVKTLTTIETYSGNELFGYVDEHDLDVDTLLEGHEFAVVENTILSISAVGRITNALKITVTDGTDDITKNYSITYQYGTLEITPRPITVTTRSSYKIYDGIELFGYENEEKLDVDNLLEGNEVVVTDGTVLSITNVGRITNVLKITVTDGTDDVTGNYSISYQYGTLEIMPRPITVKTLSDYKIYDGDALSGYEREEDIDVDNMLVGHEAGVVGAILSITNVGRITNVLKIAVTDGTDDVTGNYSISYQYGTLEITPRPISVKTLSTVKIYDGNELLGYAEKEDLDVDNMLEGHDFNVIGEIPAITDVDRITNVLKITVWGAGNDVTGNYSISYQYGTLEITPRPITVTTRSAYNIYDGIEILGHEAGKDDIEVENLAAGHRVDVAVGSVIPSITNVGRVSNIFKVSVSDGAADVTDNYSITYQHGTLEITRRQITIRTLTASKTYDGEELLGHDERENDIDTENLVDGHRIDVVSGSVIPSITNVGRVSNIFKVNVLDAGGASVSSNYEIIYQYGTLEITRRAVTVRTLTDSKPYDGVALLGHVEGEQDVYYDPLINGHAIDLPDRDEIPSVTDVGRKANVFTVTIRDTLHGNADVTNNYEIVYQYGYIEVTLLEISVRTPTTVKAYDGEALKVGDERYVQFGYIPSGLTWQVRVPAGSSLNEVQKTLNQVGWLENKLEYELVFNGGENSGRPVPTQNYIFNYTYGYLEITPCVIRLNLKNYNKKYSRSEVEIEVQEALEGNDLSNLSFGGLTPYDFRIVYSHEQIIDAGTYSYSVELATYDAANFDIRLTGGVITVKPILLDVALKNFFPDEYGTEWTYTGEVHGLDAEDAIDAVTDAETGFAEDFYYDMFRIVPSGELIDAGNYTYTVQFADGSYSKNYTLFVQEGRITIGRCEFSLELPVYISGAGREEYTYTGDSLLPTAAQAINEIYLRNDLRASDFRVVSLSGSVVNASDAPYYYTVELIDRNKAANYNISITDGSLKINKCALTVTLPNFEGNVYTAEEQLLSFEGVTITGYGGITPENYESYFELYSTETIKDVKEYRYRIRFINSMDANNFTLSVNGGTGYGLYTVEKASATLYDKTSVSKTKVYDGRAFSLDCAAAVANGDIYLMSSEEVNTYVGNLTMTCTVSDTDHGVYSYVYTNIRVYTVDGEDITRNLNIQTETVGALTIEKRDITFRLDGITTGSSSGLRTGSALFAECLQLTQSVLPSGCYFTFDLEEIQYRNGSIYFDDFKGIKIWSESGGDITKNFNITNEDTLTASVIVIS